MITVLNREGGSPSALANPTDTWKRGLHRGDTISHFDVSNACLAGRFESERFPGLAVFFHPRPNISGKRHRSPLLEALMSEWGGKIALTTAVLWINNDNSRAPKLKIWFILAPIFFLARGGGRDFSLFNRFWWLFPLISQNRFGWKMAFRGGP